MAHEHLKEAYQGLARALMYRCASWNSTMREETILSWAFPVPYLHHEVFPKFRRLKQVVNYEEDLAFNLALVHESNLFDHLTMPLDLKRFKEYITLCRTSYDEMLDMPSEYYEYVKLLELKIMTLYVGSQTALSIVEAFKQAAKGVFPQWSIMFTDPHAQVKGQEKQVKTIPALYKVVEAFESREWAISKILQGI